MKRLPFWKRLYGARRVLDIGAGHNPFHGATHLLNIDLHEGRERGGQQIHVPESATLTVGDISTLPSRTGSFDYVYASHILEHVTDPIVATCLSSKSTVWQPSLFGSREESSLDSPCRN
jgi:ubiquinone/menaquinone biosynthesis C-methylase UbiE